MAVIATSPRTKQPCVQVLLQRWVQSCTLRHWEAAGKRNTSPLIHTRTRTAGTVSANASTQPSGSTLSTSSVPLCAHSLPAGLGRQPCAGFCFVCQSSRPICGLERPTRVVYNRGPGLLPPLLPSPCIWRPRRLPRQVRERVGAWWGEREEIGRVRVKTRGSPCARVRAGGGMP